MGVNIEELLQSQKMFFQTGATLSVEFRKEQLKKLYNTVKNHEQDIAEALNKDLGKSAYEGFMC